jgi:hypothetical protein
METHLSEDATKPLNPTRELGFTTPAALCARYWLKRNLSFRGPATLPPDECDAGCRAEESTVRSREGGRGSPRRCRGGETARQGQCGASRQSTSKRTVDSSVAHKVLWSDKVPSVRSLGMTDWWEQVFHFIQTSGAKICHSEARPRSRQTNATQVAGLRNLLSARARADAAARAVAAAAKQPARASVERRGRLRANGQ